MRKKEWDGVIYELEDIRKKYEDKYEELINETDMKCKRKEYWKGGNMLHTGEYCPSKTVDMICGNVSRGKRVRKEAKVGYTYFFDDNDLLIRADSKDESYESIKKMVEERGEEIFPCREFIFYTSNEMHTVKFGYGGGENEVEDVSKCIYKDGYLQEYILYINILDENKGTIEGEQYIFR